jgi:hypothetical protein
MVSILIVVHMIPLYIYILSSKSAGCGRHDEYEYVEFRVPAGVP